MPVAVPKMYQEEPQKMALNDDVVKSFRVFKETTEYTERINSIDVSSNGEYLVAGTDTENVFVFGCDQSDSNHRPINLHKYGVDLIRCTPDHEKLVHTSTKCDHSIRYMHCETEGVKYIHYFSGHTERVVTLCVHASNGHLLSGAMDRTLRLWDFRTADCKGQMNLTGRPVAAFDPTGLVFGVGIDSENIKMYDIRMYDKGPFFTFKWDAVEDKCIEWIDLKFSNDGKVIMVNTNGSTIRLIDAFTGDILNTITDRPNESRADFEAVFSPNSQYILSGGSDGHLHVWNADTAVKVCELTREKSEPMRCIRFNPRYMQLATGDTAVNFWLPTISP